MSIQQKPLNLPIKPTPSVPSPEEIRKALATLNRAFIWRHLHLAKTFKRYAGIQTDEVRNLCRADADLAFHAAPAQARLSGDELTRILSLSREDPKYRDLHDVAQITLGTGLRASELRELRWADVDFERTHLTIRQAKCGHIRTAALGTETIRILESRRERDPESDFVLGRSPRTVLYRVMHQLSALCKQAGVRRVCLHALRGAALDRLSKS